jgi:hypothetical protein
MRGQLPFSWVQGAAQRHDRLTPIVLPCVEYDRPSSLFGQFGNDRIDPTAAMLDRKLEALVAAAFE